MKKLFVLFFGMIMVVATNGQYVVDNFDSSAAKSVYQANTAGAPSYMTFTDNHSDMKEGTGALDVNYVIGSFFPWGSFANALYRIPNAQPLMDWSQYDSLSIWLKVKQAPTHPEWMVFRIHIADQLDTAGAVEEYIYENATILDAASDWVELKIPLYERPTDGIVIPNDSGFIKMPDGWGGPNNNRVLDWDKIRGINLSAVTSGYIAPDNIPADSVIVSYDMLKLYGAKTVPFVFFNGKVIHPALGTVWTWGQSSVELVEKAGPVPELNALKWVQGNEWGNGWTGFGYNISPIFNMSNSWGTDSLQFKMKAEDGVGAIRIQFESGANGKVGKVFQPTTDNQWHQYVLALRDFVPQDGTTGFDSSKVSVFQPMAEGSGIAGKVIYMSEIWTGNPVFDVINPQKVTGLDAVMGSYQNLVTWTDVPGETGETYNVYSSDEQITDVTKAEVVKLNVPHGDLLVAHILRAPNTDQDVTKYYAITCKDAAGNSSEPAFLNTSTTNIGKGVPTISKTAPANFKADGDLTEWISIAPIRIFISEGTGFPADNKPITSDADLSVLAYIAVDKDTLYFAADVTDDIYTWLPPTATPPQGSWQNDCVDLFLGLFDSKNTSFSSYQRGATPHYHFRFDEQQIRMEGGANADSLALNGDPNYYFGTKFTPGYMIEAKIPFADLAHRRDSGALDSVFVPVEGMKIPIDFSVNDNDGVPNNDGGREGILCYSPYNNDLSWGNPSLWLWTWIGNKMFVDPNGVEDAYVVDNYNLAQNYPNPFNPSTKINYSLQNPELVTLRIFDVLGREVATLVNQYQTAGNHTVSFNASSLASGMYFYKLEAGSFQSIKKMMLLK